MNFFVSSNAIDRDINNVAKIGSAHNFNMEFSSNIKYSKLNLDVFNNYKFPKLTHNYFPASEIPFVFNLASLDPFVLSKTLSICKKNIQIASELEIPIYSCHAGFAFDTSSDNLGNSFNFNRNDFELYYSKFLFNLEKILEYSVSLGVTLLIENNVTINPNYINGYTPLICSSHDSILAIAEKFKCDNFGILFDTAHYKVSSKTFCENVNIDSLYPHIKAIHHSDNNGLVDSNDILNNNYWWFEKARPVPNCIYQVLEIKKSPISLIKKQLNFIKKKYDTSI